MCEHEQNFHALDVVFLFFICIAMEDLIARSLYVFLIIRCSCLKRFLDKKHKDFDSNRCEVRGKIIFFNKFLNFPDFSGSFFHALRISLC